MNKRIERARRYQAKSVAEKLTNARRCNYSNNYYGDQVCLKR